MLLPVLPTASATPGSQVDGGSFLEWSKLPLLPDRIGFAGMAAGVTDEALVVAGGANFLDAPPWEGGQKTWHDRVFLLRDPHASWHLLDSRLPRPTAYSVSLTTPKGIAVVGGSGSDRHFADCFFLLWKNGNLTTSPLPRLPRPCAQSCGAILGNTVYIAGGIEHPDATAGMNNFWSLDLMNLSAGWQELSPWPGPSRILAVAGVQEGSFFLFGGAALSADAEGKPVREPLRDAYRFTPANGWKRIADMPRPATAAPNPAPALGQSHLLILGGDDGRQAGVPGPEHAGFPRDVLAYHTITNTWAARGELPFSLVTTPAVRWKDQIIVPGGEARPGIRSTEIWAGKAQRVRAAFGWHNFATLMAYPLVMIAIAWVCARRNKNTADYFRASGRVPWWAAGLSIYATMLSSITFMAVPAKAYGSDWGYSFGIFSIVLLAPVIIHFYLPYFRRLNVTSAYEYLEQRFNLFIRLFGSASFIVSQIGRTGIVLYLPALALSTVSSLDMTWCIVGMGLLTIALTVFGGIEAVVWTDVAQTAILLGAVLVSLTILLLQIDGGFLGFLEAGHTQAKFYENVAWSADLTIETGWVAFVGLGFNNFISYTSNQEVVQRYLTTHDLRQAGRAVWTNAIISLPSGLLFFAVGSALFVFYKQYPGRLDPTLQNDAIFPLFMLQELPAGLAGFVVAGIFAAAQPTSSLNSTASAVVTDFYRRLKRNVSDHEALVAGRITTVITGILGMSAALLAARMDVRSIWELSLNVLGLTTGTLAGVFSLGMFSRRANSIGATLGLLAGLVTIVFASFYSSIHPLLYGAMGVINTFTFGFLFSLPFPPPDADRLARLYASIESKA
ncbi:MAG: sodium/solute symporter [Pirellulales bacterium]